MRAGSRNPWAAPLSSRSSAGRLVMFRRTSSTSERVRRLAAASARKRQPGDGPTQSAGHFGTGSAREARALRATKTRALADRDDQHAALALGIRREESGDLVVVEREAGGAEAARVGPEVDPPGDDAGLELRGAVAAGAEGIERAGKVGHQEVGGRRVRSQALLEAEKPGLPPEFAGAEQLKLTATEHVRAGLDPLEGVRDQVGLGEVRSVRRVVGRDSARATSQDRGEHLGADGAPGEDASRTAPPDDLFERVGRQ